MNPLRSAIGIVVLSIAVWAGAPLAAAQAISTASKSAEISAFGSYAGGRVDYGPRSFKGVSAGADFTVFPRFPVAPSLEVRGNLLSGLDATEKTVLFGPRLQYDLRPRFHPYGTFLIGVGEIVYHPAPSPDYTADRSKVLSFGGGINIDVVHHIALKLDVQEQHWNLGAQHNAGVDVTLNPLVLTVGATYTLPFRKLNRTSDYR